MTVVVALIAFLFGLCLIISLHELGHFMFAKKYNVLCYDYSIGMGPLIYGKKKGETTYGVRAIPLGGFVSMADGSLAQDYLQKDVEIGININEENKITDIILCKDRERMITGKVVERDIYCKEGNDPFITLNVDGVETRYECLIDASIWYKPKKKIQLSPYNRCFESKTKWQRFVMLFAGPGMNFILAIFLFIIAGLLIGKQSNKPVIGSIEETFKLDKEDIEAPAYHAGLRKGDKIIKINDKVVEKWSDIDYLDTEIINNTTVTITYLRDEVEYTTTVMPIITIGNLGVYGNFEKYSDVDGAVIYVYTTKASQAGLEDKDIITKINDTEIHSWSDLIAFCQNEEIDGEKVKVTLTRDGKEKEIEVHLLGKRTVKSISDLEMLSARIGVSPKYHFDFFYSFVYSFKNFGSSIANVWNTLKLLFTSRDVGVKDLSGPVGIYAMIKNSLTGGFTNYIWFLGFLSVNIGIVNLLPIPALDGGRILFVGIEAVTRKKVSRKVEDTLTTIVFFLLIGLLLYITFNDILRIF